MSKTLRNALLWCFAACMAIALCFGLLFLSANAEDTVSSATTVPDSELVQLSIDNGTIAYSTATSNGIVRLTVDPDGSDAALTNATDIAIRVKVMNRQTNRPNVSSLLSYIRFKFVGDDTVWGITKEGLYFTFLDAETNAKSTVRVSNGGDGNIGGQLNAAVGTDGTIYIPLTQIRDGSSTTEFGRRLTEVENYSSLQLEYIEFTTSQNRWDLAFGDAAIVRQSGGNVETDVISAELSVESGGNVTLYDAFYDNVTLVVNGQTAVENEDGEFEVDLGEMGRVYIDSDKLFAYDPIKLKSDLSAGYGITSVGTEVDVDGYTLKQVDESADNWRFDASYSNRNKNRTALLDGYTYEGEYFLRFGNHGVYDSAATDAMSTLGAQPIDGTITVTVSQLASLSVTGESAGVDAYYARLDSLEDFENITSIDDWSDMIDSAEDGTICLAPGDASALIVVPKDGYEFTGISLNGETLEPAETITDPDTTRVTAALYTVTVTEDGELEILGLGDEVSLDIEVAATGGSLEIDGEAVTGETFTTNVYKTLEIGAVADSGYAAAVSAVYPAEEEGGEEIVVPISASSDGMYYYQVDGAFTLRVEFSIVTYNITYRLNNGEYAEGESNPATITYFDTVTLNSVSREGYTFLGWRIEGSGETEYITELKEIDSDITLIAVFELASGGDVDPDPTDPADNNGDGLPTGAIVGIVVACVVVVAAAVVAVVLVRKKRSKQ